MSILEGVPDVATELNDSLIVFFFRRVMGDKMRNEKRHSKTEKKNVTSEFTNNEKHCHVFSCIKVESRRCFSTRVGYVLAYANDS